MNSRVLVAFEVNDDWNVEISTSEHMHVHSVKSSLTSTFICVLVYYIVQYMSCIMKQHISCQWIFLFYFIFSQVSYF